jgi:ankyrin repeat protein
LTVVKCLVKELGADVNKVGDDGSAPLHIAAQDGSFAVVECLSRSSVLSTGQRQ